MVLGHPMRESRFCQSAKKKWCREGGRRGGGLNGGRCDVLL